MSFFSRFGTRQFLRRGPFRKGRKRGSAYFAWVDRQPLEVRQMLAVQLVTMHPGEDQPGDLPTTLPNDKQVAYALSETPSVIRLTTSTKPDYVAQLKATAKAILTTDTLPQSFYTNTARQLDQLKIARADANLRLLRTAAAGTVITQGLYQTLFGKVPTATDIKSYISGPLLGAGMRQRLFHMGSSDAYYQKSGGTADAYRQAVAHDFLGQTFLPSRYRRLPVETFNQRRALLNQLTRTSEFRTTWTAQLARVASNSGTFTDDQLTKASAFFQGTLGFERTLARLLTYPVSISDVSKRVQNVPLRPGMPISNVWATNRQWLVPEKTNMLSPQAGNQKASSTTSTTTALNDGNLVIPVGSNWGDRLGFPGVSYSAIMSATQSSPAAVPTLSLPSQLISDANLSNGLSMTMWVQAQGPGVLLAAEYSTGSNTNLTVPYLWINQAGQVQGGLYGPGGISATPNLTLLSSQNVLGQTEIGSPLSISSQTSIIDNTWHHVAFVANSNSQALYVDGLLQGASTSSSYLQNATGLTTSSSGDTITLTLDETPDAGSSISTQVYQNGACSYVLSGTVSSSGSVNLKVTTGSNPPSTYTTVKGATLNGTNLTLTMQNSVGTDDPVALAAVYQTSNTTYSLTPNLTSASGYTLGNLTSVGTGGSIFPLATGNLAPTSNYPQSFLGSVDEMGFWGATIEQAEVQAVMTVPCNLTEKVTLPSGDTLSGIPIPAYYFNFEGDSNTTSFTSQSPASNTTAKATATGLLTGIAATIPTDPFSDAIRLPGFQNYGIGIMTPLATGSLDLGSGDSTYQFALAVSDQLAISIPAASNGTLSVQLEDDLGTQTTVELKAGDQYYIIASRTGSYQMNLGWSPNVAGTNVDFNYYQVPGALNSLPELFTSFQPDSSNPTDLVYAYSDPTLPTITNSTNNDVGYASATGPANYFPLWSDPNYFPTSANYTTTDLSQAYSDLVANLTSQNTGLADFCNINMGGSVDNPADIQGYLANAYTGVTGYGVPAAPTTTDGMYPVAAADTATIAVYEFLYNTNVMRGRIYAAIAGSGSDNNYLSAWLQSVYDSANSSDIPSNIAQMIFDGQASQVIGETVPIQDNAGKQSSTPIWETALTYAVGEGLSQAALAAFGPVGYGLAEGAMYLCLGLEGLGNESVQPSVSPAYVSFTPVMNEILNYATLDDLATSIVNGQATPFSDYASTVTSTEYLQSIFSNYGLLVAMSAMTGTPLGDKNTMSSASALDKPMTQTSWQSMIPATFQWEEVPSYGFPSANMGSGSYNPAVSTTNTSSFNASGVADVVSADFNNDGIPDAALSNNASSTVSIMLGVSSNPVPTYNQSISFPTSSGTTLDTDGFTQCSGIAAGDFNNDGYQDILVNSYNLIESALAFGNGTGNFSTFTGINLAGGTNPQDVVVADFNQDGWLDFAVAAYGSSTIAVGMNRGGSPNISYSALGSHDTSISTTFGGVNFSASFTTYNIDTEGATGGSSLGVGDFNNDTIPDIILSANSSSTMALLVNAGFTGTTWDGFGQALNLNLSGLTNVGQLAVGDYDGDGNQDVALIAEYANNSKPVPASLGGNDYNNSSEALWFFAGSGTASDSGSGFSTPQWMGMMYFGGIATIPSNLLGTPYDGIALSSSLVSLSSYYEDDGAQIALIYNPMDEMKAFQANPYSYLAYILDDGDIPPISTTAFGFPVNVPNNGLAGFISLAITSNGIVLTGVPTTDQSGKQQTSQLGYSQNTLVNTLATYAPGQNGSTSLLNLTGQINATGYLGGLQGGNVTNLPNGFPNASAYVPGTTNLALETQIASPGFFLSWTPATVSGTLNGSMQTSTGGIVSGWNLVDSNGNSIALATVQALFGAPSIANNQPAMLSNLWQGTTPVPVDANNPVMAYNGGWFYNLKPINNAPTTWVGAFFNWGRNVAGFSPGALVPANASNVQIPGVNGTYDITYSAASAAPPEVSSITAAGSISASRTALMASGKLSKLR